MTLRKWLRHLRRLPFMADRKAIPLTDDQLSTLVNESVEMAYQIARTKDRMRELFEPGAVVTFPTAWTCEYCASSVALDLSRCPNCGAPRRAPR